MTLPDRIIRYILKKQTTTLIELEGLVVSKGYTLDELFTALETVHRDKRIQHVANASGEITYKTATAKSAPSTSHLTWLNDNYPRYDYEMPFPEIDMSWIVLSPEEMKKFKAELSGRPAYMIQSKHGHPRRQNTT